MTDFEQSIIGAICIDPACIPAVLAKVVPEDFADDDLRAIYEAVAARHRSGEKVDPVLLCDDVARHVPDVKTVIRDCMDACPTVANVKLHAEKLHNIGTMTRLRENIFSEIQGTDDPETAAARIAGLCQEALGKCSHGNAVPLSAALQTVYANLDSQESNRIDTGFYRLDAILKGLHGGNLVLIGARPGVGKSAFAGEIALHTAERGKRVLLFSMEMKADELAERFFARKSGVPLDAFIDHSTTKNQIKAIADAGKYLHSLPIDIFDRPNVTEQTIRTEARKRPDLSLVIVDFISLMQTNIRGDNRNQVLGAISRDLKNLAAELDIPIIALTQLNRTKDDTERPALSDIRDSGELEQNANKVLFLWNIDRECGKVGVSVAKNRRGQTGVIVMKFDGAYMQYTETDEKFSEKNTVRQTGFLGIKND